MPEPTSIDDGGQTNPTPAGTFASAPSTGPAPEGLPRAGRFEVSGEVARGSMGAVLRARDPDLHRVLALKVLLPPYQSHPEAVRRFIEEARIGGRLQHPGVVPVYELGTLADGRPFFAMKLVEGRTLADLLKERPDPAHDLPRCLQVFEQVCQAIAYAHSQGVLHRDLKPLNVMVGAFGEVQVMDWGLAKSRASRGREPPESTASRGREPPESPVEAAPTSSPDLSRPGSRLGSPAYMPPEQARGESEHIDERSDVFGLGGILCEVLTGQPPYAGPGYRAALSKAARADLADAFARLDDCGADPELVSLAKRCLSPERDDRPADAAAVAAAVAAYRAGVRERLRRAELERTAAEARAAGERHRRHLTLALAASLVLTVALAGGGWAWLERDRSARATAAAREEFEARRAVEAALDEAEARQRLADWPAARTALARAAGRLGAGGPDDLRDRLQTAERDLDLVAALDEVRAGKAAFADRFTMNAADAGYARVFRAHGLDVAAGDPAAVADRIRGSAARLALVAALDDWSLSTADSGGMRARVLTVARLADPGPWADRFRDPAVWTDRAALQRLAADAPADLSPTLLANLAVLLRTAGGDGLAVLRQAQARRPDDFWVNLVLAIELSNTSPGTPGLLGEEAVGFYRAAVALRPYSPVAYYLLGYQLHKQGRNDQAAAPFREAARLQPGFLKALILLGHVRSECGDLAGTAEALREAVRFNPDSAEAHYGLGAALLSLRHWPESVAESREAARLRPELPEVQFILGLGLQSLGQLDEAATAYRAAAAAYRATAPAELRHALAHHNLGTVLAAQGRLAEAAAEFREAIRLNPGIVPPHNDLAGVFLRQGRFAAALAELRRADELHPEGRRWPAPIARAARLAEFAADVGGWVTAPFGL